MLRNLLVAAGLFIIYIVVSTGCAQIGMPTGGDRDSIPPSLVKALPEAGTVDFKTNRITLQFDEYVEIKDPSKILISPYQNKTPQITYNLRTVTIRLRDTLRPNTTYSINFGDNLADVNEGNPYKNYTYVFSTGKHIDSLSVKGRVVMAETGAVDSTLQVYLYSDIEDSTILKHRPQYIGQINGDGEYEIKFLPAGIYKAYVLKDGDGRRTYNSPAEIFAFLPGDSSFSIADTISLPMMLAYEEKKFVPPVSRPPVTQRDRRLNFTLDVKGGSQDIIKPLIISFNQPVASVDTNLLQIKDTLQETIYPVTISFDSTRTKVYLQPNWLPNKDYVLLIPAEAAKDTSGNPIFKGDTIRFQTKATTDYGRVTLRFRGLNYNTQPVVMLFSNNEIIYQGNIVGDNWMNTLVTPGEYELKILFDKNGNGLWDPGNFSSLLQPERVITLPQKLTVRADWDNERDIILTDE